MTSTEESVRKEIELFHAECEESLMRWERMEPKYVAPNSPTDPFQNRAIDIMMQHKGFLLMDQPGLRKTQTTILAALNSECRRILIIVIFPTLEQWKNEIINRTTMKERNIQIVYNAEDLKTLGKKRITIANYDKFSFDDKYVKAMSKIKWDCLILDESQNAKQRYTNRKRNSKRSHRIRKLASKIPQKYALSASPRPNINREIVSVIDIVLPHLFKDDKERKYYSIPRIEISALLHTKIRPYSLARDFDKVFHRTAGRRVMNDYTHTLSVKDTNEYIQRRYDGSWKGFDDELTWCIEKKIPSLIKLLKNNPNLKNKKVVIITRTVNVRNIHMTLRKKLQSSGFKVWTLTGKKQLLPDGSRTDSDNLKSDFNTTKDSGIFLTSYGKSQAGIEISANAMILLNLPYNCKGQAEGRIRRGNENRSEDKYYFTLIAQLKGSDNKTELTIDQSLHKLLIQKEAGGDIVRRGSTDKIDLPEQSIKRRIRLIADAHIKALHGDWDFQETKDGTASIINRMFEDIARSSRKDDYEAGNRRANEMISEFGDELFERYHNVKSTPIAYNDIKNVIKGKKYKSFIDIGCFDGRLSAHLKIPCVGIDRYAAWAEGFSKNSHEGSAFMTWDMFNSNSIRDTIKEDLGYNPDFVVFCRSLHHLSEKDKKRCKEEFGDLPVYIWDKNDRTLKEGW